VQHCQMLQVAALVSALGDRAGGSVRSMVAGAEGGFRRRGDRTCRWYRACCSTEVFRSPVW
jgi:hypothetical protein